MLKSMKVFGAAACAATLLFGATTGSVAGVGSSALNVAGATSAAGESAVELAQRRGRGLRRGWRGRRGWGGRRGWRRRGWRRRGGRWIGPAIGAGIASIIIGGAIEASRRDHRDRWEMCDDRYRSFRWSDGTFQPYGGGPRELCPYLRR